MTIEVADAGATSSIGSRPRLAFFGSAPFAVPSLAALLDAGYAIDAVYTQPPRPADRGHKLKRSAVQVFAEARGLPVYTPETLRDADEERRFAELGLEVAVVAAYGLILPKPILTTPRMGCLNVHASLLPRWRGAAPIERAILAGDRETGITIMQMDEGLDTGPVLLTARVPITQESTAAMLHEALADIGARLLVQALPGLMTGTLRATPQAKDGVTYARKLDRQEGRLDWRSPAVHLGRTVRALNPQPGVWFERGGERIKVLQANVVERAGPPGRILDEHLTVACGEAALRLTLLQRAGRRPIPAEPFLRGFPLPPGTQLA
jgi:methionyl-tRNA formyltransferase